jgi:hypothetical protein
MLINPKYLVYSAALATFLLVPAGNAQDSTGTPHEQDLPAASEKLKETEAQEHRLLQSNGFLVETAYLQEEGELQHNFTFSRTNRRNWSMVVNEEIPLGSEKHQLSFSVPAQLAGNAAAPGRGFGDSKIGYSYGLIGNSASRFSISPGVGLSVPTGRSGTQLGAGAPGVSFIVPVGVMLTGRFASNSSFEITYTRSAKNSERQLADTLGYEMGQSLVWFAKPKLNFLIEAVWERSQTVVGPGLRENEYDLLLSPGVRWAYVLKNGLIISPGVAVPVGIGPSRGEKGAFFYISFEHRFRDGK